MDVKLPDGTVIQGVPDGTTKEDLLGRLQLAGHPAARALMQQMASEQAASDTSGIGKFTAGAGKAVADVGLGVRQLLDSGAPTLSGLVTGDKRSAVQQEVDETKARDQALMNSGAGMAGNIAGNVGMAVAPGLGLAGVGRAAGMEGAAAAGRYLLASPSTLGGAATQGTMGALQAGVQPVASGESRAGNMALGGAGGALIPAAGMALRGAKGAIEPLYAGGRDAILARALRGAVGENADTVTQNLRNGRVLVPGSNPTAAEVADSGGIAAMQRAAAAVDPEAYAARAAQQNEARVASLQGLTGTQAAREAADQARETTAGGLYRQARQTGLDPEMSQVLRPQMANLMERMPQGVLERARELARLNGEAMGKDGSLNGMHYIKLAVDDMLSGARQSGIGTQMQRGLRQFKSDLLTVMDELSPLYGQGRQTYAQMSRPINQMDVAREIEERAVNRLTGQMQPQAFARALSDDTAARATGFGGSTLANTMEPGQMSILNALREDLARSVSARDLGRGAGSNTAQNLAMTNLMQQSGLPLGVLSAPGMTKVGRFLYGNADNQMRQRLSQALLNPQETATLMERGVPSETARRLGLALRGGAPVLGGTVAGALDAR